VPVINAAILLCHCSERRRFREPRNQRIEEAHGKLETCATASSTRSLQHEAETPLIESVSSRARRYACSRGRAWRHRSRRSADIGNAVSTMSSANWRRKLEDFRPTPMNALAAISGEIVGDRARHWDAASIRDRGGARGRRR